MTRSPSLARTASLGSALVGLALLATGADAQHLDLELRSRSLGTDGHEVIQTEPESWDPARTAVVLCDLWDLHHSRNATMRVAELAPRIDAFLKELRGRGALIIHAPSSCMEFYRDHPARQRAMQAPAADDLPDGIDRWLDRLEDEDMSRYPIDQSNGGDDDHPEVHARWAQELQRRGRNPGSPWQRQIETVHIDPARDVVSDDGPEIWNVMEQRGADHVLLLGVHTNMCVLGRPFGLRQMARVGRRVALVRDLTDTMYDPRMPPYVSHYHGTELIVQHIERYVAPTVSSPQILGGEPFRFRWDVSTGVCVVVSEPEYRTWETLPDLARELWMPDRGYEPALLVGDPQAHEVPRLVESIRWADVLVLSMRRQGLPPDQLQAIRDHLAAGKPLLALRTSSHAFDPREEYPAGHATWPEFDPEVLGGSYDGHHGSGRTTEARAAEGAADHPILRGVELPLRSPASLYKAGPLAEDCVPLLIGEIEGAPPEPVAWIRESPAGRIFYTSLGHVDDFEQPAFRRLLQNAMDWLRVLPSDREEGSAPGPGGDGEDEGGREEGDDREVRRPEESDQDTERRGPPAAASWTPGALGPEESLRLLDAGPGLAVDLVLSEPDIRQPVSLSFDERGRLWVVEYCQYPHPAGLRIQSRDSVWRNVYDRVPPPPPHAEDSPFRGADRVSIHEDADGDGEYETHRVFLDGLNMATSVAHGRGGVWLLNPPYLLFYPDADRDDVPDGPPVVHLEGFGLEDSHSIANSLCWGPDGWLYGAQGSTVSADIRVVLGDANAAAQHTQGQLIWRYHPEEHLFEVYAEGGGNAFGCEIDAKGRLFSGHNGGDTRGFHYVQGGLLRKGFEKHGKLSNPYAFGYFPAMPHPRVARFTHEIVVYEGDAWPPEYRGLLVGADPINRELPLARRIAEGATFRTDDAGHALRSRDPWYRPVDIVHGPDGCLYVADWYDAQINHYRNHEGQIDRGNGRVHRIRPAQGYRPRPGDLARLDSRELLRRLAHPDRWQREQARRLLADRRESSMIEPARDQLFSSSGQDALEALWVVHAVGGLDEDTARRALRHEDPFVRAGAIRLIGDRRPSSLSEPLRAALRELAANETVAEVRSQLAATLQRVPVEDALPLVLALADHDEDRRDRYLPLQLWWALERCCTQQPDAVVAAFASASVWASGLVREHLLSRTMRRFVASGRRADQLRAARLLEAAPDDEARAALLTGFEQASRGRNLAALPAELVRALGAEGLAPLSLRLRHGEEEAIDAALAIVADPAESTERRATFAALLGEQRIERGLPALLSLLDDPEASLVKEALTALRSHPRPSIAEAVLRHYEDFDASTREVARTLLASRVDWARQLVAAIDRGVLEVAEVPAEQVAALRLHRDVALQVEVERLWGRLQPPAPEPIQRRLAQLQTLLDSGRGDPYRGKPLFLERCAGCHRLFHDGDAVGPDLTSYDRRDLDTMLLSILHPDAEVREGFEKHAIWMRDGRMLTGFVEDQDDALVVLRGADGQRNPLARADIDELRPLDGSPMPRGLLDDWDERQLRDFFAYFRSTQPLVGTPFESSEDDEPR